MKKIFAFLCLVTMFSCTKQLDVPVTSSTATDRVKPRPISTDSILQYSYVYTGNADAGFTVTFPPFKVISGILTSWKVDIVRYISGSLTIQNQLSIKNDSAICIDRYTLIHAADTPFTCFPDYVVQRIKQKLARNSIATVPINTIITDSFNSGTCGSLSVYSNEATSVSFYIRDLVTPYKPNCINTFSLQDSAVVTLTYTYQADHTP